MLQFARQTEQTGIAHGARIAGQRMGQRYRRFAHRAVLLQRPFGQLHAQPARQLIGLVEVDVEQRDANAQRADLAVGLGIGLIERRRGGLLQHRLGLQRQRVHRRGGAGRGVGAIDGLDGLDGVGGVGGVGGHRPPRGRAGRGRKPQFVEHQIDGRRAVRRSAEVKHQIGDLAVGRVGFGPAGDVAGQRRIHLGPGLQLGVQRRQRGQVGRTGSRRRQIKIGRRRQAGHPIGQRLARRQGTGRSPARLCSPLAQRIGRQRQVRRVVAGGIADGQRLDPLREVRTGLVAEIAQVVVSGAAVLGQAGIEQLLAGPGRIAKRPQAHHARAAFEGVEGAAQRGERRCVVVAGLKRLQRGPGAGQDLQRFFEEDLAHLGVVFQLGRHRVRAGSRRQDSAAVRAGPRRQTRPGFWPRVEWQLVQRRGRGVEAEIRAEIRADVRGQARCGRVVQADHWQAVVAHCRAGGGGHGPLGRAGLLDDAVKFQRDGQRVGLRLRAGLCLHGGLKLVETGRAVLPCHHGRQRAGLGIKAEQRLGHLRLHADHVDQEAQRTQVVGQPVEGAGLDGALRVDLGTGQRIDIVTHAQHRL